jgi:hypothetical protein
MGDREPMLFREWDAYMKHKQIMVASIVLKSSGWGDWNAGHAKLLAVFLWNYEGKKINRFSYREVLKRHGYRRTHNYRLLGGLVANSVLVKKDKGFYSFREETVRVAEAALQFIAQADIICSRK